MVNPFTPITAIGALLMIGGAATVRWNYDKRPRNARKARKLDRLLIFGYSAFFVGILIYIVGCVLQQSS